MSARRAAYGRAGAMLIRVPLVEETNLVRGAPAALLSREQDIEVVAASPGHGRTVTRALSYRPDAIAIVIDIDGGADRVPGTSQELATWLRERRTLRWPARRPRDTQVSAQDRAGRHSALDQPWGPGQDEHDRQPAADAQHGGTQRGEPARGWPRRRLVDAGADTAAYGLLGPAGGHVPQPSATVPTCSAMASSARTTARYRERGERRRAGKRAGGVFRPLSWWLSPRTMAEPGGYRQPSSISGRAHGIRTAHPCESPSGPCAGPRGVQSFPVSSRRGLAMRKA
ncbi:hypothetical protein ACFWWT_39480 [Streptomyces sp. NPDC058676]|uniref:hypothetical protein n=1 Tax=unclassified Streptomyces TaxID=2593676 RepID=UPI00365D07D3